VVESPPDAVGQGRLPLRRDGGFRRYWLARVISLLGSMVTYVALPVLVYQVTASSLWTALVTVAQGAPYLCVGLLAGAVADRGDRRRLMVGTDLASAAVLASVPVAYAAGALTPPHVLAAAFCAQTLFVFFDAANFGALPLLVGRDRIVAAQAALIGTGTMMELAVPALAGAALAVVAPAPLLAVDALSFVVSALLLGAITRPLSDPARVGQPRRLAVEVRDGLRFLWRQPIVRTTTLVGAAQAFVGGVFIGQLVPWADQILDVPPRDGRLGLLFAAWGLGGLAAGRDRHHRLGGCLHRGGAGRDHPAAKAHPRPAAKPGQHRRADAVVRAWLAAWRAGRRCGRPGARPSRRAARLGQHPAGGHDRGLAVTPAHNGRTIAPLRACRLTQRLRAVRIVQVEPPIVPAVFTQRRHCSEGSGPYISAGDAS
jgi:Transmembrane secretion effector